MIKRCHLPVVVSVGGNTEMKTGKNIKKHKFTKGLYVKSRNIFTCKYILIQFISFITVY